MHTLAPQPVYDLNLSRKPEDILIVFILMVSSRAVHH